MLGEVTRHMLPHLPDPTSPDYSFWNFWLGQISHVILSHFILHLGGQRDWRRDAWK